jgi:hypothetical protein
MDDRLGLIVKVFVLSVTLSIAIKYGGRLLPIAPTSLNAAIAVFLPTAILAFLLIWRARNSSTIGDR